MTNNWPLLSIVTFLPILGALFVLSIRGEAAIVARNARNVALLTSLATFLLSLLIWVNFDPASADFQMIDQARWLPGYSIVYKMGVDGISLFFVILSTFLDRKSTRLN